MNEKIHLHELKEDHRAPYAGWADGGYICRCEVCGEVFVGDKRAYNCADCAYNLLGGGELPKTSDV